MDIIPKSEPDEFGVRYTDPLNNSLIEIDLSCNPITNAGLEIIALFLSSDQNIIYNLGLAECKITYKGGIVLINALQT